jgi:hypothetical protein
MRTSLEEEAGPVNAQSQSVLNDAGQSRRDGAPGSMALAGKQWAHHSRQLGNRGSRAKFGTGCPSRMGARTAESASSSPIQNSPHFGGN